MVRVIRAHIVTTAVGVLIIGTASLSESEGLSLVLWHEPAPLFLLIIAVSNDLAPSRLPPLRFLFVVLLVVLLVAVLDNLAVSLLSPPHLLNLDLLGHDANPALLLGFL